MIALSLLFTLARLMLLAMLCFASAVVVLITHTTTVGATNPARACVTIVVLFTLGLSFLSRCLVALAQLALAITSASITGTSALANSCSWSLRFLWTTWWQLAKGYSTARTPLCPKTLSEQYFDL